MTVADNLSAMRCFRRADSAKEEDATAQAPLPGPSLLCQRRASRAAPSPSHHWRRPQTRAAITTPPRPGNRSSNGFRLFTSHREAQSLTVSSSLTSYPPSAIPNPSTCFPPQYGSRPCLPSSPQPGSHQSKFQSVPQSWHSMAPLPATFPSNPKPTDGTAMVSTVSGSFWGAPQHHWTKRYVRR